MLKNLTRINKPLRITLDQMMRLIGQCDLLDPTKVKASDVRLRTSGAHDGDADSNGIQTTTSNSLYSGILPGKYTHFVESRKKKSHDQIKVGADGETFSYSFFNPGRTVLRLSF